MPTIQEKALIVVFNASVFNPRKTDQKVTREVVEKYDASTEAGRFVKSILPEAAVAEIARIVSASRQYHYQNSLPWLQDGGRIIPIAHFPVYSLKMSKFKEEFDAAVSVFCGRYLTAIEEAKIKLKDMFNQEDYPSQEAISSKFKFSVISLPIPCGQDFRVTVTSEILENMDNAINETVTNGIQEVTGRVRSCLEKIVERLQNPENTFRNSLISNLEELTSLLPVFNITDSKVLSFLHEQVEPLSKLDPEVLRENSKARQEACDKAKEILSTYLVDEYEEI